MPGAESASVLAVVVVATRYAPAGRRGACPIVRSGGHLVGDWPAYAAEDDAAVGVVALVETSAGVAAAYELCGVPGLAAVMLGPFDLSVAMGVPGQLAAPEVTSALDQVIAAARSRGLPVLVPVFSTDAAELGRQARHWLGRGASALTGGADKLFFMTAAVAGLRAASVALLRTFSRNQPDREVDHVGLSRRDPDPVGVFPRLAESATEYFAPQGPWSDRGTQGSTR